MKQPQQPKHESIKITMTTPQKERFTEEAKFINIPASDYCKCLMLIGKFYIKSNCGGNPENLKRELKSVIINLNLIPLQEHDHHTFFQEQLKRLRVVNGDG